MIPSLQVDKLYYFHIKSKEPKSVQSINFCAVLKNKATYSDSPFSYILTHADTWTFSM